MKSTGVVRRIDELGRIVLPVELRRTLDIEEGDSLEIFTESDTIVLKKYAPGCVFCGDVDNIETFKGKHVCKSCIAKLK
jgi:transcriptional pleiotropic regulator of transition state genes